MNQIGVKSNDVGQVGPVFQSRVVLDRLLVAYSHGEGILLSDSNDELLAARYALIEEVVLEHDVRLLPMVEPSLFTDVPSGGV